LPRILVDGLLQSQALNLARHRAAKIRSFGLSMPAFAAGVSSIGDTTLITPFSIVTSMPSPPNSPLVVDLHVA
jgi:hypothetical protein